MDRIRDAYKKFFDHFHIKYDELTDFALEDTIFVDFDIAKKHWEEIKKNILNKKSMVIRNYGRNGSKNILFEKFYESEFGIKVNFDSNNNSIPTQTIEKLTSKHKNKEIINYQVSHVFSNTKNIYLFNAPWNFMFTPKYIDPFTGHESKGPWKEQYSLKLQKKVNDLYNVMIEDYNQILVDLNINKKIDCFVEKLYTENEYDVKIIKKFKNELVKNFSKILIS